MRVGVLLVVVGVAGAGCGSEEPRACDSSTFTRNLPMGEACPSAVELGRNCPELCYSSITGPSGTDCKCIGGEGSLVITCNVTWCAL
jgi:hypothetical protein